MRVLFVFVLLILAASSYGQNYPQGYFRNPLGIPISLAGNFGECRPGHFHMGLDLKTEGRENLPVYAAAGGYVSRIKTEPGGFGHAIYLTHPAGYTTVYAHLNDFVPALQKHLRDLQYARESWMIDETLEPGFFFFTQGQQIAWSGNTGGSTAPHLHFEIRDTKTERALNPQLFGFEIKDTRPPVPTALAVYDLRAWFYSAQPTLLPLRKAGGVFQPAKTTVEVGTNAVGFGVVVDDFMDGSANTLALYTADLYVADEIQTRIRLDDIGYDETRYLHAYADYGTHRRTGRWVQLLFQLPGNGLARIYEHHGVDNGRQNLPHPLTDSLPVRIVLRDVAGNATTISFDVLSSTLFGANDCNKTTRRLRPDSPLQYEDANIRYTLPAGTVYDNVCLKPRRSSAPAGSVTERHMVGAPDVPAHTAFSLSLKPVRPVPFGMRQKLALMYSDGKTTTGRAAIPEQGGWYSASVRAFGEYWLASDTSAPVVKPIGTIAGNLQGKKSIAFIATDAVTSVKSFRGEIDGKWMLFEQHGNKWTYVFDERCPPGKHTLVIRAADQVGNETRRSYTFTR